MPYRPFLRDVWSSVVEANSENAASRQAPQAPNDNGESRWALLLNGSAVVSSSSSGGNMPKRLGGGVERPSAASSKTLVVRPRVDGVKLRTPTPRRTAGAIIMSKV